MEICCDIARDLEPLYGDGLASFGSRAAIKAHLAGCPACRSYYRKSAVTPKRRETAARADYRELANRVLTHRIIIACAVGAALTAAAAAAFIAGGKK